MSCDKCIDIYVSPEDRTVYWEQVAHDRLLEIARMRARIMDLEAQIKDMMTINSIQG